MLTLEENGWNFKAIKICSVLNLFLVQIDTKIGRIQRQGSRMRILLWRLLFCLAILHIFYMIGRLIHMTMLKPEPGPTKHLKFRLDHFILHFAFTVAYSLNDLSGYYLFVDNPGEVVIIFNQLYVQRENPVQKMLDAEEGKTENNSKLKWRRNARARHQSQALNLDTQEKNGVRSLLKWPPQYPLDEMLAKTFSWVTLITIFFFTLVLAVDPSRPQLLYASLPPEYQNLYSFIGLLLIEAVFVTLMLVFGFFSIVCQLLFFGKCQLELKRLTLQLRKLDKNFQSRLSKNRNMKREIWVLGQIVKGMRELVVFIELFNCCFPPCIFALKLICLALSIPFYCFTIRHDGDFPFLVLFTGYCAVTLTLTYGIMYEKAFSIPEKIEQLKMEFLRSAQKSASIPDKENRRLLAEMKRAVRGIRDVGAKVGSFHTLERQTTPRFVDFVVKNVVNLLVTFPR